MSEPDGQLAALVPAYRPDRNLGALVRQIVATGCFAQIVVVDDGSGPDFADLFSDVREIPTVTVLRHATNLGKGAALKTGMNFLLLEVPDLIGVVTADADGQHAPDDIQRVAQRLREHPSQLILGCRQFDGPVPLRSLFGNVVTRGVFTLLVGRRLSDTQTGLRGIPAFLMKELLSVQSNRYEFEMDMLIMAARYGQPFVEEKIKTIYLSGNQSSHFNPILDSLRVYFCIIRFALSSSATYVIDLAVFSIIYAMGGSLLASQVGARLCAACVNYFLVRDFVFHAGPMRLSGAAAYAAVVLISGVLSYFAQLAIIYELGWHALVAKVAVESVMFFASFAILRSFVFVKDLRTVPAE
jgi:glycosyltransferase involved in cell wall biosynthesis